MSVRSLAVLMLVVAVAGPCWSGSLVYLGPKPTDVTSAADQRTELEKLQDKVDKLSESLWSAHYLIGVQENKLAVQQEQLDACLDVMIAYEIEDRPVLEELAASVQRDSDGRVTISGSRIDLNADTVDADGEILCDTLTAEFVDGESYDPGAGNVW